MNLPGSGWTRSLLAGPAGPGAGIAPLSRRLSRILPVFATAIVLSLASGPASAQESPLGEVGERRRSAEVFVHEKLELWQRHLGLEDWNITVVMSSRGDLKPKTLGGIKWDKARRTAVLRILDAAEYTLPVRAMLDDMEMTLVHELIHIHLASLPRSEASRREEERAVNSLARALLNLDRRK